MEGPSGADVSSAVANGMQGPTASPELTLASALSPATAQDGPLAELAQVAYAKPLKSNEQPPTGTTQAPQGPRPPAEGDNPINGALNWLGDKAGTVKDKAGEVAAAAGDKAKALGGAAFDKARDLLSWPISTAPERAGDVLNSQKLTVQELASGMSHEAGEILGVPGEVLDHLRDRDIKGALGSAAKLPMQPLESNIGNALVFLGNEFDSVQTAIAESPGRSLESDETEELTSVFGNSIDYEKVRLKEGPLGLWNYIAAGDAKNPRPLTLGDTIYLFNQKDDKTLVHEMMHVWQHQHGGTDYIFEAQQPQLNENPAAYRWTDDVPKVAWSDLSPEKQAEFISDAYGSALVRHPPHFIAEDLQQSAHGHKKDGEPDPPVPYVAEVNSYLGDALAQLRAGQGAP
jgi:hypothetical protein